MMCAQRTYVYALFDLNDYIRVKDKDKECFWRLRGRESELERVWAAAVAHRTKYKPFSSPKHFFFSLRYCIYIQVIKEPFPHHMCMWAPGRCDAIQQRPT